MVTFGGGRCLLTIVMLRHMPAVRANPNYAVSKCFRLEYYRGVVPALTRAQPPVARGRTEGLMTTRPRHETRRREPLTPTLMFSNQGELTCSCE